LARRCRKRDRKCGKASKIIQASCDHASPPYRGGARSPNEA
jgi:hypothetical protein